MVVLVDGARFLPACTTVSRVVGSVWSSSGLLLAGPFEGVSQPASEARCPAFMAKALLDAAQAGSSFDDPTATLLLQVWAGCLVSTMVSPLLSSVPHTLRHKHKSTQAQDNRRMHDPSCLFIWWMTPVQVHTIERSSRTVRVVGFGLLALFLDPRDGGQPLSRSISDYVLNSVAFQVCACVTRCVCVCVCG